MSTPSGRKVRHTRPDARGGFTLVEVVVAIMMLAVGVLALATSSAQIVRQITMADLESERAVAFQTVVNQMQSLPYANVVDGTSTIGVYAVSWAVANDGSQSKIVTITTVGPGVSATTTASDPARSESFRFRVLRR